MSEKIWSDEAWEDYLYWQTQDKKILKRINALIKDIERNGPLTGIGDSEALKDNLHGCGFGCAWNKPQQIYPAHRINHKRLTAIAASLFVNTILSGFFSISVR